MSETSKPGLTVVAALTPSQVIGKSGSHAIPWHYPEDMKHFRAVTRGHAVIMGRATYDTIGKPLPGRRNIVVTRQADWNAQGAERAGSLEQALASCADSPRVWVTGGAELYRLALPHADVVEVTVIDQDFEGDACAPELGAEWHESARASHVSANGLPYSFLTYRKRPA